jgi:hypothetical protein
MGPLTQDARVLGKAAMEESLTVAARARRRFKAGRPTKTKGPILSPLAAMTRAVDEYTKLQSLMEDEAQKKGEESEFSDTKAGLVYTTLDGEVHTAWLPQSIEGQRPFYDSILDLAPQKPVFIGILFSQFDRHTTKPEAQHVFWVLQLAAGPLAEKQLRDARDTARLLGS